MSISTLVWSVWVTAKRDAWALIGGSVLFRDCDDVGDFVLVAKQGEEIRSEYLDKYINAEDYFE